jgi:hypothetical protein
MDIAAVPEIALAARSWPDTTEEYLSSGITVLTLVAFMALSMFSLRQFMIVWRNGYITRLTRESQEFRAQWPADRLGHAPFLELEAEVERCWQLVLVLEERAAETGDRSALDQSAAVRSWIGSLAKALPVGGQ